MEIKSAIIGMGQMEVLPGQPLLNYRKAADIVEGAIKEQMNIVVLPELCIPGYLIGDAWERPSFLRECEDHGKKLAELSGDIVIVFGNIAVDWNKKNEDGRPRKYNACFVAENGEFITPSRLNSTVDYPFTIKTLQPNYREFDDNRHFYDARKLVYSDMRKELCEFLAPFRLSNGINLGCVLCEDGWDEDYAEDPIGMLAPDSDVIINISCSPYTNGKNKKRNRLFSKKAREIGKPLIYVNNVGVQDNGKTVYSFDGSSCAYANNGEIIRTLYVDYFEECLIPVSVMLRETPRKTYDFFNPPERRNDQISVLYDSIINGIEIFSRRCKIEHVVIGASGGVDSALVAALYSRVFPSDKITLVNMPSRYNSTQTITAAKQLSVNIGCNYEEVGIEESVKLTDSQIEGLTEFMLQNVQARDRSSRILAAIAAKVGGVFTCNANKSEMTVGYTTLYGDLGGYLAPIADLWKTQVYEMARYFNENIKPIIPIESIDVKPSAELSDSQDVTKGLGDPMVYEYHDCLFKSWVERWNRATLEDILTWALEDRLESEIGYKGNIAELFNTYCNPSIEGSKILCPTKRFIVDVDYWWRCYQGLGVAKRIQAPPVLAVSARAFGFDHREAQFGVTTTEKFALLSRALIEQGL